MRPALPTPGPHGHVQGPALAHPSRAQGTGASCGPAPRTGDTRGHTGGPPPAGPALELVTARTGGRLTGAPGPRPRTQTRTGPRRPAGTAPRSPASAPGATAASAPRGSAPPPSCKAGAVSRAPAEAQGVNWGDRAPPGRGQGLTGRAGVGQRGAGPCARSGWQLGAGLSSARTGHQVQRAARLSLQRAEIRPPGDRVTPGPARGARPRH